MILKTLLLCVLLLVGSQASIYSQYYPEAIKIVKAMNLDQKIGQTIQADFFAITSKQVTDPNLAATYGSLLISGNGVPSSVGNMLNIPNIVEQEKIKAYFMGATLQNWQALTSRFTNVGPTVTTAENKTYKIKLLLGTDAVHNDQHVLGTVLFPHNIGLSCSHNSINFYNVGKWTAVNLKKSGFNYAFAPTVAVSHNPQWGRYYETMGQEEQFISQYAKDFVRGVQNVSDNKINGVLGSAKHFLGDGATLYGADEGNARTYSTSTFVNRNTQGYKGAVSSEIGSVMASYSAVNDVPNSLNSYYLNYLLREKLGFDGFVISDYDQTSKIANQNMPTSYVNMTEEEGIATLYNAGVDMIMLSGRIDAHIKLVKKALNQSYVFLDRIEDAAAKIISVKMAMGLITQLRGEEEDIKIQAPKAIHHPKVNDVQEYQDSLQAVRESLVLLKNDNATLPARSLTSTIKYVVLVGEKIININRLTRVQLYRNFDNIGMQCGGWSVRWQGFEGNDYWSGTNKNLCNASSILDGLTNLQRKNNFSMLYPNYTNFNNEATILNEREGYLNQLKNIRKDMNSRNTLIIGVVGEVPYAESAGDINIPYCQNSTGDDEPNPACLYNSLTGVNPYVPGFQSKTLQQDYANFDQEVISSIRTADKNIPLVTVVLSGRPVLIKNVLNTSSAVLSAFLPGTSGGQGIVDAIVGDYVLRPGGAQDRRNSLSFDWPSEMNLDNFPIYTPDGEVPRVLYPAFEVGHGLSTA